MHGKFRRFAALCCLWAALLSGCLPVLAQPISSPGEIALSEALAGRLFPLSLTLGDLARAPQTWQQFAPDQGDSLTLGALSGIISQPPALGPYGLYFTQGKTFRSGNQTFLVAYHVAMPATELSALLSDLNRRNRDVPPEPVRLPSDTVLALSLLGVGSLGDLNDIKAFDTTLVTPPLTPAQKKAAQAEAQSAASISNLKQIGLGLMQYTQDYDEMFPPMRSATREQVQDLQDRNGRSFPPRGTSTNTVQNVVFPYVRSARLFVQPATNTLYRSNFSLSHRNLASIEDSTATVTFYEAAPDAAGKRAVAFVDGHVTRINERDWPQLRRASLITIRLTGAASLYYAYRKRQSAPPTGGLSGRLFISQSTGRLYVRYPDGKYQWIAPPSNPVEVPFEMGQYLGLSRYQGYNNTTRGKIFGGYGVSSAPNYPGAVPATLRANFQKGLTRIRVEPFAIALEWERVAA